MKALSIKQPWADFIMQGRKTIEIRVWKNMPQIQYPVEIAIHTGKNTDMEAFVFFTEHPVKGLWLPDNTMAYPKGCILGTAVLSGIKTYISHKQFESDRFFHLNPGLPVPPEDFGHGAGSGLPRVIGLVFSDIKKFDYTIPWRGELGFFEVDIDTRNMM